MKRLAGDEAPQSVHTSGILVAKNTGHTTADALRAARSPYAPPRLQDVRLLAFLAVILLAHSAVSLAGKPGGKSRYRSVSHGQAAAQRSDKPTATAGNGVFGFRSFLGGKGKDERDNELLTALPAERLTPQARQRLAQVTDKPAIYRRLPTQTIRCDEELFLFLTRKPEAIIGIWDLMGITKVQTNRIGPYKLSAVDGSGTTCDIDLLYGDRNLHVFLADGGYDGKFTQKPIRGKGVFVFKSTYSKSASGDTTVTGTLDCYIKFESLGADFLARSLGGLIGNSADHNFTETAKFINQISHACENNPGGMIEMVDRMPQVDVQTKTEFVRVIMSVSQRYQAARAKAVQGKTAEVQSAPAAKLVRDRGIRETNR